MATQLKGSTVDSNFGLDLLLNREAYRASEENRKALGGLFKKSILESTTFGVYGGITSINDFKKN